MDSLKLFLQSQFADQQSIRSLEDTQQPHACVSLILRGESLDSLELGFIERAQHPKDRWSGHIAFPGGRREVTDSSHLNAAIRETLEEIEYQLDHTTLLGRLDDIQARRKGQLLHFYIRPFVFYIPQLEIQSVSNAEVADFFWTPLKDITDQSKACVYSHIENNQEITFPAVDLKHELPLWGLSYLMTLNLISVLDGK